MGKFKLSQRSLGRLVKPFPVHPDLVKVVIRAIKLTEIDFGVTEGGRSFDRQKELVAAGSSWTLDSYHLVQITGYSHAVDLVAYIGKSVSWDMRHYAKIAEAMLKASKELDVPLVWGAVWDKELDELDLRDGLDNDIDSYVDRFRAKNGKRPHLDGPHFQLSRKTYKR